MAYRTRGCQKHPEHTRGGDFFWKRLCGSEQPAWVQSRTSGFGPRAKVNFPPLLGHSRRCSAVAASKARSQVGLLREHECVV